MVNWITLTLRSPQAASQTLSLLSRSWKGSARSGRSLAARTTCTLGPAGQREGTPGVMHNRMLNDHNQYECTGMCHNSV